MHVYSVKRHFESCFSTVFLYGTPSTLFSHCFFVFVCLFVFNFMQGSGCFGGFLASMLVAYLLSSHKVSNHMSAYQLFRNALHFLGEDLFSTLPSNIHPNCWCMFFFS